MVDEAPSSQPAGQDREEVSANPEAAQSSSNIIKRLKEKIRHLGPKDDKPLSPGQESRRRDAAGAEPELPSRARKRVDRFCQAHGFSNPLVHAGPDGSVENQADNQEKVK
ncbi:hypothetical protein VP01_1751g5 [Puccinia sorghi]|uniref:Uncharacterized protein n=1 Tax=Puccinia sorghi TaxID=27349 RepID=A0A0L6VFN8_9BASI|nr:hypothetical protein VP01_1751g5 [Puccinia sorghi]